MSTTFSLSALVYFLSLIPTVAADFIVFRAYFRTKYRHYLFIGGVWLDVTVTFFVGALALLLQNSVVGIWSFYIYLPVGFLWVCALDTMSRDAIGPGKIVVMTVSAAAVIFTSFDPQAIAPVVTWWGEAVGNPSGAFGLSVLINLIASKLFLAYYFIKIYKHIPQSMKGPASSLFLFAGIFSAFLFPLSLILQLGLYVPGFNGILFAFLSIIGTYPVIKEPKIAFVLPFKALRLVVIDTSSGLALFNHTWNTDEKFLDDDTFSSLIQGLGLFAAKAIGKGQIREMTLDQAMLIINRLEGKNFACVLITTRSSRTLRDALQSFTEKFS